jgi:non-homologous end joining protein Ku
MSRVSWKGAISFSLVHIPVERYSTEKRNSFDPTLLDRRTIKPVGEVSVMNTLRYTHELRAADEFEVPPKDLKAVGIVPLEIDMAAGLAFLFLGNGSTFRCTLPLTESH